MRPPRQKATPVRLALEATSHLQAAVQDGLGALKSVDKGYLEESIRTEFVDSLDLDAAMLTEYPSENRWDYLLGHVKSGKVFALEPHTMNDSGVSTLIKKREKALGQLEGHLRTGATIADWFWVSSVNDIADTEGAKRRLDQAGIKRVGKALKAKHLEG